jgi:hypothetical protein
MVDTVVIRFCYSPDCLQSSLSLSGGHQTFRLRLPGEPVDYRFNVYRAALCTDKEVDPD